MDHPFPEVRFRRGIPALAVAPAEERIERDGPVLVWGPLAPHVATELEMRGIEIVRVTSYLAAIESLACATFRGVAVDPQIDGTIALVKRLKLAPDADLEDLEWEASSRQLAVPFVVLPLPHDEEYAVIVAPPEGAFVEDESKLPIARALLDLDFGRLVPSYRA